MIEKETFLKQFKKYLKEKSLISWTENASVDDRYMFFYMVFSEDENALKSIISPSKNINTIDTILAEIKQLPPKHIRLSEIAVTNLLVNTVKELVIKPDKLNALILSNIVWYVISLKDGVDIKVLKDFIKADKVHVEIKRDILKMLNVLDPYSSYGLFQKSETLKNEIPLFISYLSLLSKINAKEYIRELIAYNFEPYKDKDELQEILYLKTRKAIRNIPFKAESIIFLENEISKLHEKSWKKLLINNVLKENEDLKILLKNQTQNDSLTKTANYINYYNKLYNNFDLFFDSKRIYKLENHDLFDWKLVVEVSVNKIFENRNILKTEIGANIGNLFANFYKNYHISFSSFISDHFQAEYKDITSEMLFKNRDGFCFEQFDESYLRYLNDFEMINKKKVTDQVDKLKRRLNIENN